MKTVIPKNNSRTNGHYVPGVISQGMFYVSGQLPINPVTGLLPDGGIEAQTRMALANVETILQAAGTTKDKVVQCRVYISNVAYWDEVNAVYTEFFGSHKPARVVVPSRELHCGALVEIEAIAEVG